LEEQVPLSPIPTAEVPISAGRGELPPARLAEHLQATVSRLKKLGLRPGDSIASLLPDGPDAATLRLALTAFSGAELVTIQHELKLAEIDPKLLLSHPGEHPLRQVAAILGIPVVNVLRHFEAGVFTLEAAVSLPRAGEVPPPRPQWKSPGVPLVLIAPESAYCQLAKRLDACNPVIGITPPRLEMMPLPHTIEHVAAECVRMLRPYRQHGPYALAGWREESLVALEMARLLEEKGEKVAFVALLDASSLFHAPLGRIGRVLSTLTGFLRTDRKPFCEFMQQALRQYRPAPWHGKILHIRPRGKPSRRQAWFRWRDIAPHGLEYFEAPGEMFAEPSVQTVARILASQFDQTRQEPAHI
jgi:hypothetical protein